MRSWDSLDVVALVAVVGLTSSVSASVIVNTGTADTFTQALSGRAGSLVGPLTDDPVPSSGTSGVVASLAAISAGPVPADPELPVSFPGTTGIASANASASLDFTPVAGQFTIAAALATSNVFQNMDGGTYLANAAASFSVTFSVSVATPFTLSGVAGFNLQDALSNLRLVGPFGTYAAVSAAGNGAFSFSGVLDPGDYTFDAFAGVGETTGGSAVSFGETGGVSATLTIVPTPGAATLLGLGALGLARRRRA